MLERHLHIFASILKMKNWNLFHSKETRLPEVSYFCPPQAMPNNQDCSFTYIFNTEYLNDFNGGGRQVFHEKTFLFNPCLLRTQRVSLQFYRFTQKRSMFVIIPPRVYQRGFNSGYNIASAVNYSNSSWFDFGDRTGRRTKSILLSTQGALSASNFFGLSFVHW